MKLIGPYKSNLAPFQYDQLLELIKEGVASGEFAASAAFDASTVQQLQKAAQDFSSLAVDSAGQRVTEDSLNRPVSLLQARYGALADEAKDFTTRAGRLLSVIEKDETLIDQLLAAADLETWAYGKTPLLGSVQTKWDFGMGFGRVASDTDIAPVNPANNVNYASRPPIYTILDASTGGLYTGVTPPVSVSSLQPKSLTWSFTSDGGESSQQTGPDWAGLSIVEPVPLINFTQDPLVQTILPVGGDAGSYFAVSGRVPGGSIPVYVRVLFEPRRNSTTIIPLDATLGSTATAMAVNPLDNVYIEANISATLGTNGSMKAELALYKADGSAVQNIDGSTRTVPLPPVSPNAAGVLSSGIVVIPDVPGVRFAKLQFTAIATTLGAWSQTSFRVHLPTRVANNMSPEDVSVFVPNAQVYFQGDDFLADDSGQVTIKNVPDGMTLNVLFAELYPAYQCSVDNATWSPIVMLDPARPYPDDETSFLPVRLGLDADGNRTLFPLTDELGNSTGLYVQMKNTPPNEFLFQVSTPATGVQSGASAVLQIEFERPTYLTHLSLAPFTVFPCRIDRIETQAFTTDTRAVLFSRGVANGPLFDRQMRVRFPRTLVRRVFLSLYQENYESNEHRLDPPDMVRREALASLQSALPNVLRRPQQALPDIVRGAQYDFGVENILGEDWTFQTPAVIIAGPYRLSECPEVLRFDSDQRGSPAYYLCFRGLDKAGNAVDLNISGVALSNGACVVFPWASGTDMSLIANTDIYLKIVLTSAADIVQRFMLQTTKV